MSDLPGYDAWKLRTPEEDYEASGGKICPFCGAYDPLSCEMLEETEGVCPWEENESEPDPDDLMERRREDREMEASRARDREDF